MILFLFHKKGCFGRKIKQFSSISASPTGNISYILTNEDIEYKNWCIVKSNINKEQKELHFMKK